MSTGFTALIETMKASLKTAAGALGQFRQNGAGSDTAAMYDALLLYWSAVRDTFPEAWGRPSTESRLMHSAGIRAMGALMDTLMLRADAATDKPVAIREMLGRLAPHCCWTDGKWEGLGFEWNAIQSTAQHIAKLTDHLFHLERDLARTAP